MCADKDWTRPDLGRWAAADELPDLLTVPNPGHPEPNRAFTPKKPLIRPKQGPGEPLIPGSNAPASRRLKIAAREAIKVNELYCMPLVYADLPAGGLQQPGRGVQILAPDQQQLGAREGWAEGIGGMRMSRGSQAAWCWEPTPAACRRRRCCLLLAGRAAACPRGRARMGLRLRCTRGRRVSDGVGDQKQQQQRRRRFSRPSSARLPPWRLQVALPHAPGRSAGRRWRRRTSGASSRRCVLPVLAAAPPPRAARAAAARRGAASEARQPRPPRRRWTATATPRRRAGWRRSAGTWMRSR